MSWFDDNASKLEAAGIPREAAEDFVRRNTTDGKADTHRVFEALGPDYAPRSSSSGGSSGGGSGGGSDSWMGRSANVKIPFTPFAETFAPSVPMPGDLMTPLRLSRDEVGQSDAFQLRMKEALQALERSAAAKGSYLTPNTMQALTDRAQDLAHDEYGAEWNRRADDRTSRAGTYFNQFDRDADLFKTRYQIHRNNQLDPFGMGMQIRGQDRADRSLDFDIDQGLWGRGITERQEGRADRGLDFSMNDLTRKFDFDRDKDAFTRSRSSYNDYMNNLYRFGMAGRPL